MILNMLNNKFILTVNFSI